MSNTRAINRRADRDRARRAPKRQRTTVGGSYHDCAAIDFDLEIVHSREVRLTSQRGIRETPRSPQRGRTTWVIGDSWAPLDDNQIGLDPDGEWNDEEFAREGIDAHSGESPQLKKGKGLRSKVSVRVYILVWQDDILKLVSTETPACCVEGAAQGRISR